MEPDAEATPPADVAAEEAAVVESDKSGVVTSDATEAFEASAAKAAADSEAAAGAAAGSKSSHTLAPVIRLAPLSPTGTGLLSLPSDPNPFGLPSLTHAVVVYRVSSGGYAKHKPPYITKETCLLNFVAAATAFAQRFPTIPFRVVLIKDNCTDALDTFATRAIDVLLRRARPDLAVDAYRTDFGSGAASFNFALDALNALSPAAAPPDSTGVYMLEDDYLHTKDALSVIFGGLALAPYVTGYDHPDKYVNAGQGGNPLITGGGEVTRVYRGPDRHWRGTNSTTMTFATTLDVLRRDGAEMRMFTQAEKRPPDDFHMFLALGTTKGRLLVSPVPAVSTHGETAFLSPFVDWGKIGQRAVEYLETLEEKEKTKGRRKGER